MNFRQASILRSMLRLGFFSASEIADLNDESEDMVIETAKANADIITEVQDGRTKLDGSMGHSFIVEPEKQLELLDRLEPFYALTERPADVNAELPPVSEPPKFQP